MRLRITKWMLGLAAGLAVSAGAGAALARMACSSAGTSCAGNWQVGGSRRDHRRGNRDGRRRNTFFAPARSLECRGQNITAFARRNQLSAVAQIFRSHLIDVGTNAADANAFISSPIHPRVINPVQAVDRGAVTQHRATGGIFFRHA